MAPRYRLDDGERHAAQHPDSFMIPPRTLREALPPGTLVKLGFLGVQERGAERMWVEVMRHFGGPQGVYLGLLRNDPVTLHALQFGDTVRFRAEHVLDIEGLDDERSPLWKSALSVSLVALVGYLAWRAYKARSMPALTGPTTSAFTAPTPEPHDLATVPQESA